MSLNKPINDSLFARILGLALASIPLIGPLAYFLIANIPTSNNAEHGSYVGHNPRPAIAFIDAIRVKPYQWGRDRSAAISNLSHMPCMGRFVVLVAQTLSIVGTFAISAISDGYLLGRITETF